MGNTLRPDYHDSVMGSDDIWLRSTQRVKSKLALRSACWQSAGVRTVLASASPRRLELLRAAGFDVDVRPANVNESPREGERPHDLVVRLALDKCTAVKAAPHDIVVAADTAVVIDGADLGKPADDDDARRMLRLLSGRTHEVMTGFCVRRGENCVVNLVVTDVTFRELDDAAIDRWLSLGQHRDKAGAYAIQGAAVALVKAVSGSLTNVIGLPVDEVVAAIREVSA